MSENPSASFIILTTPLPVHQNPVAVYLAGLTSPRSRRVMAQALRSVAALLTGQDSKDVDIFMLDWSQLRYMHTAALRSRLAEIYSPATANRTLSAVRGVLKEAWQLGYMSAEDYHRAANVKSIKGETLPAGRELSQGEILALVQVCKSDTKTSSGVRDAAIIGLLYTCGLRRAEIVALNREDFDAASGKLMVKAGKGRKQRTVYVLGGALRALTDWLAASAGRTPLFVPVLKSGKIIERRMNAQSIYDMLRRRAIQSGVPDFSPHDFRRTFVGEMLERGVDIATVANIAGHASVDTTRRYDRRPEETKKRAATKLHFPY
jgi:integrase